ncbi:MAG: MvaI/BcnI restriction endonuclease family protein [Phycisphaeraceae bacterium]|nr:MAG: MvaI/BcnI restriction endonuclease family protein [Phycisphaeraceae bacterium]
MSLKTLLELLRQQGATRYLAKILAPNDNSKNQFYVGGSSEVFSILPPISIIPDQNQKGIPSFKASLDFSWVTSTGERLTAPDARLIYYPQYPEVRLSSLIQGCPLAPSELLKSRDPGRVLVLGVSSDKKIFGYLASAGDPVAKEVLSLERAPDDGVFITLSHDVKKEKPHELLFDELCRVSRKGWISGMRLARNKQLLPCRSTNCGGYTLEAELGISSNGYSEPDFLGWEVKSFSVPTIPSERSVVVTLMTPEPTGGYYTSHGPEAFIRKYGYPDRRGRLDRLNFGGIYRVGAKHETTRLTMNLDGSDKCGTILRSDGHIALTDEDDQIAASWSFKTMLEHWNRKHSKAAFVPNMMRLLDSGIREYQYGNHIRIGEGTDFQLLLRSFATGAVYYDPGLKIEAASSDNPRTKRRSQFRTTTSKLQTLYHSWREVDACAHGRSDS